MGRTTNPTKKSQSDQPQYTEAPRPVNVYPKVELELMKSVESHYMKVQRLQGSTLNRETVASLNLRYSGEL